MVGRTPEYLGKKIESYDVQMAMLYVLIFPFSVLLFAAVTVLMPSLGLSSLNNAGPHGLSEILYAYASATGNNGSAFAGLNANTHWYNLSLTMAMLIGPFPDDRAHACCRGQSRAEEGCPAIGWNVSGELASIYGAAGRSDPYRRCLDLLPGLASGSDS